VRVTGPGAAARISAAVARVVDDPPTELAGAPVVGVDRPAPDVIVLRLEGGGRAVVRPSGTEPKVKCYLQVVLADIGPGADGWQAARDAGEAALDGLQAAIGAAAGLT
jgi:phosphomannomutase